jgi:ATP-dependent Clp protease ATP-binding subunit ClpA
VLTSGRGERVYFSEALLVFTSNLGIFSLDDAGNRVANVTAEEPLEKIAAKVRLEIEKHFKLVLNRPEILNRLGENIIVFDFIRPEVAGQIFEQLLTNLLADIARAGFSVSLAPPAHKALRALCLADLSNGGRGIRNRMEALFINPLSRALFDGGARIGGSYRVEALASNAMGTLSVVEVKEPQQ